MKHSRYISERDLVKNRFWSHNMIVAHLGQPDDISTGEFDFGRVRNIERKPYIRRQLNARKRRLKKTPEKSCHYRVNDVCKSVVLRKDFRGLTEEELRSRTVRHYQRRHNGDQNIPDDRLNHEAVNYVRHCGTSYDSAIKQFPGQSRAILAIKSHVLMMIMDEYPFLTTTCREQLIQSTQFKK